MSTEDLEPDIPAEKFEEFATLPQFEMVHRMKQMGWQVSHLWKRDEGDIVVWLIAKTPGGKGYSHALLDAGGSMERYYPKKIRVDFGG